MAEVSIRELRNQGGKVIDRVHAGERVTVTRDGVPVAELHPVTPKPLSLEAVLERRHHLDHIDPAAFQSDIDDMLDQTL